MCSPGIEAFGSFSDELVDGDMGSGRDALWIAGYISSWW